MKTQTIIFALATVIFAAPAFADHNPTDEQGRKHGHWTELPDNGDLHEGHYKHGNRHGPWVLRSVDGTVSEGSNVDV